MARLLTAVLFLSFLAAAPGQDPKEVARLEGTIAEMEVQHADRLRRLREVYRTLEAGFGAPTDADRARLIAELGRVLEPMISAGQRVVEGGGARNPKRRLEEHLKAEAKKAFDQIEIEPLKRANGYLVERILGIAANSDDPKTVLGLGHQGLAEMMLRDVLSQDQIFAVRWNALLAKATPEAIAFAEFSATLAKTKEELLLAKDPLMRYRIGAPEGFARVPAGNYVRRCTRGHATGLRKVDKKFSLRKDVYLGLHEVTSIEYSRWLGTLSEDDRKKHEPVDENGRPLWVTSPSTGTPTPKTEESDHPVVGVRLPSAVLYAQSLGARLPTEEEWVAAASGPGTLAFPWGPEYKSEYCNDKSREPSGTMPVGSFELGRGPFGHYDLAGNVSEWTVTGERGKTLDFADLSDTSVNAVLRGGSFASGKLDVGTGWVGLAPALFDRKIDLGFRLALDPQ